MDTPPSDYPFLTERQNKFLHLRQSGMTYKAIAEAHGITYSAVSQTVKHAERRIREWERYNAKKERNNQSADFPITLGELKLIRDSLYLLERNMLRNARIHKDDWKGTLAYEYDIVSNLRERTETYLRSANT